MRVIAIVVAMGVALGLPGQGDALAEGPEIDFSQKAKELYDRGMISYNQERYRDATNDLLDSYSLKPKPDILFAIADAYKMLWWTGAAGTADGREMDRQKAIWHYQKFILEVGKATDANQWHGAVDKAKNQVAQLQYDPPPPMRTSAEDVSAATPVAASVAVATAAVASRARSPEEAVDETKAEFNAAAEDQRRLEAKRRRAEEDERMRREEQARLEAQERERAEKERARAEQERARAEKERARAEAARLRAEDEERARAEAERPETPAERNARLVKLRRDLLISAGVIGGTGLVLVLAGAASSGGSSGSDNAMSGAQSTMQSSCTSTTCEALVYSGAGLAAVGITLWLSTSFVPKPTAQAVFTIVPQAGPTYVGLAAGGAF